MDFLDQAAAVRKGEELPAERLAAFLKDAIPGLRGPFSIRQFPSGYSNLTYLIAAADRELVLRRPPFGTKARTAHDMGREYRILEALRPEFPYCPRPLAYTEDPAILGCPFYVMERMRGIILRRDLPPGLRLSGDQTRRLCERLQDIQAELHALDYRRLGLASFGKPAGYVKRQVEGWSARYRAARTPDAPDYEEVMAWVAEKLPPDPTHPAVIHNDYKLDNVVLDEADPTRIIAILDWEMATIGDPLTDLGNSLAYWVQQDDPPGVQAIRTVPTHLVGALTRRQMLERYAARAGRPVVNWDFYYGFGLFRLAVIAQQIYYRYFHGQTRDPRFAGLVLAVKVLEEAALRVTRGSRG